MNIFIANVFFFYLVKISFILELIAWGNALIFIQAKATDRTGVTEFTSEAVWFTDSWCCIYSVYNSIEWQFSFVFQEHITYDEQICICIYQV